MDCKTCNDTGFKTTILEILPCEDCSLGDAVRDEMEREQFEYEQQELERLEMERHFEKHPHG